jgi:hypothetical protein
VRAKAVLAELQGRVPRPVPGIAEDMRRAVVVDRVDGDLGWRRGVLFGGVSLVKLKRTRTEEKRRTKNVSFVRGDSVLSLRHKTTKNDTKRQRNSFEFL